MTTPTPKDSSVSNVVTQVQNTKQKEGQVQQKEQIPLYSCKVRTTAELNRQRVVLHAALFDPTILKFMKSSIGSSAERGLAPNATLGIPYVVISPFLSMSIPPKYVKLGEEYLKETSGTSSKKGKNKKHMDFQKVDQRGSKEEEFRRALPSSEALFFECLNEFGKDFDNEKTKYEVQGLQFVHDLEKNIFAKTEKQKVKKEEMQKHVDSFLKAAEASSKLFEISNYNFGEASCVIADHPSGELGFIYMESQSGVENSATETQPKLSPNQFLIYDSIQDGTGRIIKTQKGTRDMDPSTDMDLDDSTTVTSRSSSKTKEDNNEPITKVVNMFLLGDSSLYRTPQVEFAGGSLYFIEHETIPAYQVLGIQHTDISANNLVVVKNLFSKLWKAFFYALDKGITECFNIHQFITEGNNDTMKQVKTRIFLLSTQKLFGDLIFTPLLLVYMYRKAKYDPSICKHKLLHAPIKPLENKEKVEDAFIVYQNTVVASARTLEQVQTMDDTVKREVMENTKMITHLFGKSLGLGKIIKKEEKELGLGLGPVELEPLEMRLIVPVRNEDGSSSIKEIGSNEYRRHAFRHEQVQAAQLLVLDKKFSSHRFIELYNIITKHLLGNFSTLIDAVNNPSTIISHLTMEERRIMDMFQ
jgi:hypothetical protein